MTDQKQAECREAFEAEMNRIGQPLYKSTCNGRVEYGSEGAKVGWQAWQAARAHEAQQRPDLRAVREALEFYANPKNWWTQNATRAGYHNTNMDGSMERYSAMVGAFDSNGNWFNDCGGRAARALPSLTTPQAAQEDVVERGYVIRGLQYALAKWRSDCTPEGQAMQRHIAALQPTTRDKEGV